ncbi:FAS-associated death domain protein-like [Ahaetulla prasina]|uniref:FAS-associated death domain protein-like n=1 Tax=Ahaetulla prasina TaxID=499056 RepID=UPI002648C626|nr:FAS-associated death domain protein-like [Ahaetulla prasina]
MDERERLLGILEELPDKELKAFAFLLPDAIPRGKRNADSRVDLAKVLLQYYPENALDVLAEVLNKIPRKDLVLQLQGEPRRGGSRYPRTEEEREKAAAAAPSKLVSQEQLMKLARKMGKNWKEIGILFLGMEMSRLEQFEEEHSKNMVMQIFSMLLDWRNREKNKATARHLYNILNQEGVELDVSAYAFLLE